MTYEELVEKVREGTKNTRVSKTVGHVAFQFNVEGEGEGAFYVEVSGGKINVEPYEYYDRDLIIVATADVIVQMLDGELAPMAALTNQQLKAYGDVRQLEVLPFGGKIKK